MGSPSASNESNDTQVSGYEAAITKQNKGTKKEINKGKNIIIYSDSIYAFQEWMVIRDGGFALWSHLDALPETSRSLGQSFDKNILVSKSTEWPFCI